MAASESAIRSLIRRAARGYIAGPSMQDACGVCERLQREGIANTVCYWDVYSDHSDFISQAYIGLLNKIAGGANSYLSVKAPALNFDIDLVQKVLSEARRVGAVVHFDAMAPDT